MTELLQTPHVSLATVPGYSVAIGYWGRAEIQDLHSMTTSMSWRRRFCDACIRPLGPRRNVTPTCRPDRQKLKVMRRTELRLGFSDTPEGRVGPLGGQCSEIGLWRWLHKSVSLLKIMTCLKQVDFTRRNYASVEHLKITGEGKNGLWHPGQLSPPRLLSHPWKRELSPRTSNTPLKASRRALNLATLCVVGTNQ